MKHSVILTLLLLSLFSLNSCKKHDDPMPVENQDPPFVCVVKHAVEIKATEDTYVFGYNGGNSNSFGSERNLAVGSWRSVEDMNGMFYDHTTYLKFDYAQIPSSAVIDRAFITLSVDTFNYNNMPKYASYGHSVEDDTKKIVVSNVTGDWSEATLNYFNQPTSSTTHATATSITTDQFQTYTFDVTDIVKEQLVSGNKGFKIEMQNFSGHNILRFASSENAYPALSPKITILY